MSTAGAQPVVQLRWELRDDLIVVTPYDQDRFAIKVNRAIEILQQANRREEFERQFNLLLRELASWLNGRRDVEKAIVTHRDGALSFVVVRKGAEYDEAFEDALSDLDFDLARDPDLNLIRMNAVGLPQVSESALAAFVDPDFALSYLTHGD